MQVIKNLWNFFQLKIFQKFIELPPKEKCFRDYCKLIIEDKLDDRQRIAAYEDEIQKVIDKIGCEYVTRKSVAFSFYKIFSGFKKG